MQTELPFFESAEDALKAAVQALERERAERLAVEETMRRILTGAKP